MSGTVEVDETFIDLQSTAHGQGQASRDIVHANTMVVDVSLFQAR